MISAEERAIFDEILEEVLAELPESIHRLLEEVPLIVEDRPSVKLLREMGLDPQRETLCGLHWGIPLTCRSVEHSGTLPDRMMIFREPIMEEAGFWDEISDEQAFQQLRRQIRLTVLHEIGHHFGLEEEELRRMGYA